MENILSLNLKKVFNIVSALFLSAAVIFGSEAKAEPGYYFEEQAKAEPRYYFEEKAKYGSWSTGYFHIDNKTYSRMLTYNYELRSEFGVDLDGNYFNPYLIVEKTPKYKGRIINTDFVKTLCQLRIDSREIFYNNCLFSDSTDHFVVVFGSGLGQRFLEEAIKGYTLRIKIGTSAQINFSLKGFTKGFEKILQLNSARW